MPYTQGTGGYMPVRAPKDRSSNLSPKCRSWRTLRPYSNPFLHWSRRQCCHPETWYKYTQDIGGATAICNLPGEAHQLQTWRWPYDQSLNLPTTFSESVLSTRNRGRIHTHPRPWFASVGPNCRPSNREIALLNCNPEGSPINPGTQQEKVFTW